jgi:hypothetical protein
LPVGFFVGAFSLGGFVVAVKLKNLTGAPITIRTKNRDINLGVDGPVPEFSFVDEKLPGIPVDLGEDAIVSVELFDSAIECDDLPDPVDGVVLIVPTQLSHHPYFAIREDLMCPGPSIVDGEGKIEAYDGLTAGAGLSLALFEDSLVKNRIAAVEELVDGARGDQSKQDAEKGPELQPAA